MGVLCVLFKICVPKYTVLLVIEVEICNVHYEGNRMWDLTMFLEGKYAYWVDC